MKLKVFWIMGLSYLVLGSCVNAQNSQFESGANELTTAQKEDLRKLYLMYNQFVLRPGISEEATVEERTEPLPWAETRNESNWNDLKD